MAAEGLRKAGVAGGTIALVGTAQPHLAALIAIVYIVANVVQKIATRSSKPTDTEI